MTVRRPLVRVLYERRSTRGRATLTKDRKSHAASRDSWIEERGWLLNPAHVYVDDGVSGFLFKGRPSFQRMLRAAEEHAFDVVVLFELDRFGRNARRTMEELNTLADLGIGVWDFATGRSVDLDSFEGRISATLRAEFAQEFRDTIRVKVRAGMHSRARKGKWSGRKPIGYRRVPGVTDGEIEIDPQEAQIVVAIHERYADGFGLHSVVRWLNDSGVERPRGGGPWRTQAIAHVLRNPIYRGEFAYCRTGMRYGRETKQRDVEKAKRKNPESDWIRVRRPELRIVSEELARRVDARLSEGGRLQAEGRHRASYRYLCSGLIVCPDCGAGFEAWGHRGVYACSSRRLRPGICATRINLPILETDQQILASLEQELLGGRVVDELLSRLESAPGDERERLGARRTELVQKIERLVGLAMDGLPGGTVGARRSGNEFRRSRLRSARSTRGSWKWMCRSIGKRSGSTRRTGRSVSWKSSVPSPMLRERSSVGC